MGVRETIGAVTGLGWTSTALAWLNGIAGGEIPVIPQGPDWLIAVTSALIAITLYLDYKLTDDPEGDAPTTNYIEL